MVKYSVTGDMLWRDTSVGCISGVAVSHQGHM